MKKIKLNPHQQRRPAGGHHYRTDGVIFTGPTLDVVVNKVRRNRIVNGIPVGDPKEEILRYYERRFPFMVMIDESEDSPAKPTKMYELWRAWIMKFWAKLPPGHIPKVAAKERWDVCKSCPHNKKKDWEPTEESREMDKRAMLLRRAEEIPSTIGFCALHCADLGVLSFFDKPTKGSLKPQGQEQPPKCWVVDPKTEQ